MDEWIDVRDIGKHQRKEKAHRTASKIGAGFQKMGGLAWTGMKKGASAGYKWTQDYAEGVDKKKGKKESRNEWDF